MTSKTLNKIMIVAAILFCVIFGVSVYIKNERLRRLDEAYDKQMEEQRKNENQNAFDDASQTQKNNQTNNGSNTSSEKDVDFTNFVSVYSYAENKLNKITYIRSTATGTGTLSGSVTSPFKTNLSKQPISISYERAKNKTQKFFAYNVKGTISAAGTSMPLNYWTSLYKQGATCKERIAHGQDNPRWETISNSGMQEKYGWDVNETFHIINKNSVTSSSMIFDNTSRTYIGKATLNVKNSTTRMAKLIQGLYDGTAPAQYQSCELTVTFDEHGNFKTIQYQESFNVSIRNEPNDATISAKLTTDYVETFHIISNTQGVDINIF